MAYDEGLAELLRSDLIDDAGVEEKKMFGGVCFMLDGHMLCGVHTAGGMFRVGKSRQDQALRENGVSEMAFTGRKMGGIVDVTADAMADERVRGNLMALACANVASLPPR